MARIRSSIAPHNQSSSNIVLPEEGASPAAGAAIFFVDEYLHRTAESIKVPGTFCPYFFLFGTICSWSSLQSTYALQNSTPDPRSCTVTQIRSPSVERIEGRQTRERTLAPRSHTYAFLLHRTGLSLTTLDTVAPDVFTMAAVVSKWKSASRCGAPMGVGGGTKSGASMVFSEAMSVSTVVSGPGLGRLALAGRSTKYNSTTDKEIKRFFDLLRTLLYNIPCTCRRARFYRVCW